MVKIRLKHLVLSIVLFIVLINAVYAAGTKLLFDKVDVKVGGDTDRNLLDRELIGEDARPGDNIEFKITVIGNPKAKILVATTIGACLRLEYHVAI